MTERQVDLLTAGFPCQDVSVAGQRKGLAGERTGLFREIIRIAERLRPNWLLLENVPGLRSSHRGRDFGTILTALDGLGYGVAWASLDAQWRGLAQRRERVFFVGHLGAPCPAEILFEPESLSGNPPPRRETGERTPRDVAACLNSGGHDGGFRTEPGEHIVSMMTQPDGSSQGIGRGGPVVTHALRSEGADASEDGTGRGTPIVAFDTTQITSQANRSNPQMGDPCHPLASGAHAPVIAGTVRSHRRNKSNPVTEAGELVMTFVERGRRDGRSVEVRTDGLVNALMTPNGGRAGTGPGDGILAPTLRVGGREQGAGSSSDNTPLVAATLNPGHEAKHTYAGDGGTLNVVGVRPRRLTPRECERLQGFPDDWTLVDGASDSARYRALGNAVAVPVAEWILRRIPVETVGELFCGIGGFGLAASRVGKRILWASEIDPFCRKVYATRFPTVELVGDVRDLFRDAAQVEGEK